MKLLAIILSLTLGACTGAASDPVPVPVDSLPPPPNTASPPLVIEDVPPPEIAPTGGTVLLPVHWVEGPRERFQNLSVNGAPPPLIVRQWLQGQEVTFAQLRGKVVLVVFWATWSTPSLKELRLVDDLHRRGQDRGLSVISICASRGSDQAKRIIRELGFGFPVALDLEDRTANAYRVDGYPDYYLIDKRGRLRIADLVNENMVPAVDALLTE